MAKQINVRKINGDDGPSDDFVANSVLQDRIKKLGTPEGVDLKRLLDEKHISKEEFEAKLKEIKIPS
jgi:hypothetical protein